MYSNVQSYEGECFSTFVGLECYSTLSLPRVLPIKDLHTLHIACLLPDLRPTLCYEL